VNLLFGTGMLAGACFMLSWISSWLCRRRWHWRCLPGYASAHVPYTARNMYSSLIGHLGGRYKFLFLLWMSIWRYYREIGDQQKKTEKRKHFF
jgi:hypothetical protein